MNTQTIIYLTWESLVLSSPCSSRNLSASFHLSNTRTRSHFPSGNLAGIKKSNFFNDFYNCMPRKPRFLFEESHKTWYFDWFAIYERHFEAFLIDTFFQMNWSIMVWLHPCDITVAWADWVWWQERPRPGEDKVVLHETYLFFYARSKKTVKQLMVPPAWIVHIKEALILPRGG